MTTQPYTYLGLTNEVLLALNEVLLTSANFGDATGFHAQVKESINYSIQDIIEEEDSEWDFQWATTSFTVSTDGTQEYSLLSTTDHVDWDSFYIEKNQTFIDAGDDGYHKELQYLDYDNWRKNYRENDKNMVSTSYTKPNYVVRKPDSTKVIVSPPADLAYEINYEYFIEATELEDYNDVPLIPEKYKSQIVEKAKTYSYMFRDNIEQSALQDKRSEDKINRMRRNSIPQAESMRF